METIKCLNIRLWFNISNNSFYIQIGKEILCKINDKIATRIQEVEKIEIQHALDVKDIRFKTNYE